MNYKQSVIRILTMVLKMIDCTYDNYQDNVLSTKFYTYEGGKIKLLFGTQNS